MTTSPEALREAVERLTVRGRPLRCLLAEMRDVSDWIERTKPQGLLYDSARPALRDAADEIDALLSALQEAREALGPFAKIIPSSLFPEDGSEGEVYELFLTDDPCAPVSGAELAKAREVYRALSPGGADE